jgi:hypothetical protein
MTRQEIEKRLDSGITGKYVTYTDAHNKQITGKVYRLAVWVDGTDLMVIFHMDGRKHECDLRYFADNITIHDGSTRGTTVRDILRDAQGD